MSDSNSDASQNQSTDTQDMSSVFAGDATGSVTLPISRSKVGDITITDSGAVRQAIGFASRVSGGIENIAGQALDAATNIAGQTIDAATKSQVHAYDYADNIFSGAVDFANKNDSRALDAFDRAAKITSDALDAVKNNDRASLGQVQLAYADAKGTSDSQSKIMIGVLVLAAVIGVAALRARG